MLNMLGHLKLAEFVAKPFWSMPDQLVKELSQERHGTSSNSGWAGAKHQMETQRKIAREGTIPEGSNGESNKKTDKVSEQNSTVQVYMGDDSTSSAPIKLIHSNPMQNVVNNQIRQASNLFQNASSENCIYTYHSKKPKKIQDFLKHY